MIARPTWVVLTGIVLLSAWCGAALLAAAVVAPAAFDVLPTRTMAGALVGRVLPVLFWSGMALALFVALIGRAIDTGLLGTAAALALAGSCAAAQLVIAPRIEAVRASIGGPLDALDASDPRRQAFGKLHGASVLCLGVAGVAALVSLILSIRFASSRSSP